MTSLQLALKNSTPRARQRERVRGSDVERWDAKFAQPSRLRESSGDSRHAQAELRRPPGARKKPSAFHRRGGRCATWIAGARALERNWHLRRTRP